MKPIGGNVDFIGSFPGELPDIGLPEIAFAGRSNVGKSSALNCLLDSKRAARVSSTPGRTQAINLFRVHNRLTFADLPGYGFAKVPEHIQKRWKPMVEGYLGTRDLLRLVIVFVDVRRDPMDLDLDLVDGLRDAKIPFRVVATKSDKLKRRALDKQLAFLETAFPGGAPIPFSSHTRSGRDLVWRAIDKAAR